jgi:uncharacterized protein (DUF2062 family)
MNDDGPRMPEFLVRMKRWLAAHHMTLMTIADTPHSVALGSAIGVFFGFTPLLSLKTLLSIAVAWAARCNKIAAVIAVTLHDIILPLMPAIYWSEYKVGYLMLHGHFPGRIQFKHFPLHAYFHWKMFAGVIWPTLVGSLYLAVPSSVIVYFLIRLLVGRAQTGDKKE